MIDIIEAAKEDRLERLRIIVMNSESISQQLPCEEEPNGYFSARTLAGGHYQSETLDRLIDDIWQSEHESDE